MLAFYRVVAVLFFLSVLSWGAPRKDSTASESFNCSAYLSALKGSDTEAITARTITLDLDMGRIRQHLNKLAGVEPIFQHYKLEDRFTESNKEWARYYIVSYLESLGHKVVFEPFGRGLNFYIEIKGSERPEEVFEVTAHYDTVSEMVPGGDDNGSGTGALLEFATLFLKHPPKRTLRLVFMDMEEQSFLGSEHHAKKVRQEFFPQRKGQTAKRKFMGGLVIDQIGWNPKGKDQRLVLEIGEASDLAPPRGSPKASRNGAKPYDLVLECAQTMCFQFLRFADAKSKRNNLTLTVDAKNALPETADHGSYWEQGLPALLIAAPYEDPFINPGYHSPEDTVAGMNWDYYEKTMAFATEAVASMVGAEPQFERGIAPAVNRLAQNENKAIKRATDHVKALTSKTKRPKMEVTEPLLPTFPSGERRAFLEAKTLINLSSYPILFLERGSELCTILNEEGKYQWIFDSEQTRELIALAMKLDILILRKKDRKNDVLNFAEIRPLSDWIKKVWAKATPGTKVKLPPNMMKPPEEEIEELLMLRQPKSW